MESESDADAALIQTVAAEAERCARLLRLPAEQHSSYDDIVQESMIIALRKIEYLRTCDLDLLRRWLYTTMFLVARNSRRAEFRHTAAWERLRDAFNDERVRAHFDDTEDGRSDQLRFAIGQLSELDQKLLLGQIWIGYSVVELADKHDLTVKAVRHRLTRARSKVRETILEEAVELGAIKEVSGHVRRRHNTSNEGNGK
jgi:DNA-directed RNA polymerase specialized sigma24 family protein